MKNNRKKIFGSILPLFMLGFILAFASVQLSSCSGRSEQKNTDDKSAPVDTLARLIDSIKTLYDYTANQKPYKLTFLEFGSTNCIPCKMMESVLDSVREEYSSSVNVIFYNVRDKKNKVMIKHYGIELIPVQVLLDDKGNECFRHLGYFQYDSLNMELKKRVAAI